MSDEAIQAGLGTGFEDDVVKLQDAAADLASTRTIDHEERVDASATAHRLAHALEQAGRTEAAAKAHEVIATLDHAGLPQPERLQQQVKALSESLQP